MEFTDYHTRLAAYVLLVDEVDGRECVLLAWWNGEGHSDPAWSLPGGDVEAGDHPDGQAHDMPLVSARASSRVKRPS